MTTKNKIDANEPCEVECPDCGGEGSYESDEFSHARNGGHYTQPHRCETCDGTGKETITRYAALDREHAQTIAEKARLRRELNAAHERIVALTKQLQSLRSGGDGGAATPAVPAGPQDRTDSDGSLIGFGV